MRVAIDMLLAEQKPGGMLLATRGCLSGLARIDHENEYIIITKEPEAYPDTAGNPNMQIYPVMLRNRRAMLLRHQLIMPGILRKIRPDLLHTPAYAAPLGWRGPLVLTVHDLAFLKVPQQSSLQGHLYWRFLLHENVKRARRIIVVSEQTRDELKEFWSVKAERTRLIHNTIRPSFRYNDVSDEAIQEMQRRYGKRYLLHTGRIMPRKNVEKLVQAFGLLAPRFEDLHLVLTGGAGFGSAEVIRQIEDSPYRERIHLAGWVPEEELAVLYSAATAFVFPSKHEGFGLPIIEAMACGTPVVASYEAASKEVAGEAALRTDCSNEHVLSEAIDRVLTDDNLRHQLISAGRIQAQLFINAEATAIATRQIYLEALGVDETTSEPAMPALR